MGRGEGRLSLEDVDVAIMACMKSESKAGQGKGWWVGGSNLLISISDT